MLSHPLASGALTCKSYPTTCTTPTTRACADRCARVILCIPADAKQCPYRRVQKSAAARTAAATPAAEAESARAPDSAPVAVLLSAPGAGEAPAAAAPAELGAASAADPAPAPAFEPVEPVAAAVPDWAVPESESVPALSALEPGAAPEAAGAAGAVPCDGSEAAAPPVSCPSAEHDFANMS